MACVNFDMLTVSVTHPRAFVDKQAQLIAVSGALGSQHALLTRERGSRPERWEQPSVDSMSPLNPRAI